MSRYLAMQYFGAKLRRLRKDHGMTLQKLADAVGYSSHTYVSELEKGRKVPTTAFVIKVAEIFSVSTDYLLDNKPPTSDEE